MFKSHNSRGLLICLVVTLIVLAGYLAGWMDMMELKTVDFRFQWRGDRPKNKDIVVVAVDEKSIESLGRWPWPRATHADLVRKLAKAGAKVVAFDTLFTEPDLQNPRSDAELGKAARQTGLVVSSFFFKDGIDKNQGLKPQFPIKGLAESSYLGFVNLEPDADGVTRRAALYALLKEKGEVYPSLAVATLALSQKKSLKEIITEIPVVVDSDPALAVNDLFINYTYEYPTYSYLDVLREKIKLRDTFQGKIVFVGATAAALFDMKAVPFVSKYPGVIVHANVVDNLISRQWIREVPNFLTVLYVLLVGLVLGIFLPQVAPWKKLGVFVFVTVGIVASGYWVFSHLNFVIHIVPPFVTAIGCYGGTIFYRLLIEEREKRKIKGSFKQYLSPKIIDLITKDPAKLKLGGEEREVSIFFLDIAGFTSMSEALKPTQLVVVMNQVLTTFSSVIFKNEGLINKYIGDCIMAFWNAPMDQPNHAAQACLAALDCISAIPELNESLRSQGLPSVDCRIGINTGTVVVGNMGSNVQFDYTVMGDPVNLASRLEGANKEYHSHIMISDVTFEKAREAIEARDLDMIRVKGKKEPRRVYELLSRRGKLSSDFESGREKYHMALKMYRDRNFDEALHAFEEVLDFIPNDYVVRKYLERIRTFKVTPPPSVWDGVFEMKSK